MRLPYAILCAASVVLGVFAATPVFAAPACATIESNRVEAATLGVPAENIVVVDDLMFISDYTKALGLPIPDDSQPEHMMFIALNGQVYIALVEPDGCIKYAKTIPLVKHSVAFKAATSGV